MTGDLLSVFDIAQRLNLHVKTVRNHVREGRLRAVRVGRQYRISRADLEAYAGGPLPPTDSEIARRAAGVEVTSIVAADAVSPEIAETVNQVLTAFAATRHAAGERLSVDTVYDRDLGRLKVILLGGPTATASALGLIGSLQPARAS
jgi:excisionase family DNA binding protein